MFLTLRQNSRTYILLLSIQDAKYKDGEGRYDPIESVITVRGIWSGRRNEINIEEFIN